MNSYQSTVPEWEHQESQQQGTRAPETQKQDISILQQLEALKAEIKQQQDKLYRMYYIDPDLRCLIISILNNAITAEPESLQGIHLQTYALEITKSFNIELLYVLVLVSQGLSLEQVHETIMLQNDVPE
jgi:hypothetical protein